MSFNDVARQRQQNVPQPIVRSSNSVSSSSKSNINVDPLSQISDSLQNIQKSCMLLKDKITDMRRRKVSMNEKMDLDNKLKELRDLESRVKLQLDTEIKNLESSSKSDVSQKKITVTKLFKDYERLRLLIQNLSSESGLIKVSLDALGSLSSSTKRAGNGSNNNLESSQFQDNANNNFKTGSQKQVVTLKEVDIDSLIIEERERDIKKINQDIIMVNEMFRDMANIVEKQNEMVTNIAVTTEQSHEKAQQGLEQVKQAASHQSACIIS